MNKAAHLIWGLNDSHVLDDAQIADEGFDPIHPESIIAEKSSEVKLLGKLPEEEAKVRCRPQQYNY